MKNLFKSGLVISSLFFAGIAAAPALANVSYDSQQPIEKEVVTNNNVKSVENSPRSSVSNTNVGGAYFSVNNDGAANRTQLNDCSYAVPSLGVYASGSKSFDTYGGEFSGNPGSVNFGAYFSKPLDGKGKALCQVKFAVSSDFSAIRACLEFSKIFPDHHVFTPEDWVSLSTAKPEMAVKYAALCNKYLAMNRVKVVEQEVVQETIVETPTKAPRFVPTPRKVIPGTN